MTKLTGVVHERNLEGGFWELVCDDGRSFVIHGGDARLHTQGLRVEVEGRIDEDTMGIAMAGPIVDVRRYRVLR